MEGNLLDIFTYLLENPDFMFYPISLFFTPLPEFEGFQIFFWCIFGAFFISIVPCFIRFIFRKGDKKVWNRF